MTQTVVDRAHEDRILPAIVYGLFLLSVPSVWAAVVLGLIVAYASRDGAGARMRSHYEFLIQTFWKSIWWVVIGVGAGFVGLVFTITLVLAPLGIPMMILGWGAAALVTIWFYIRCFMGLYYLVQDEPYPRPNAWLF